MIILALILLVLIILIFLQFFVKCRKSTMQEEVTIFMVFYLILFMIPLIISVKTNGLIQTSIIFIILTVFMLGVLYLYYK